MLRRARAAALPVEIVSRGVRSAGRATASGRRSPHRDHAADQIVIVRCGDFHRDHVARTRRAPAGRRLEIASDKVCRRSPAPCLRGAPPKRIRCPCDGPSTRAVSVWPTKRRRRRAEIRRCMRHQSDRGVRRSFRRPLSLPERGWRHCPRRNRRRRPSSRIRRRARTRTVRGTRPRVSPGNPTMNEVRSITPGIVARMRSIRRRKASPLEPRFMLRQHAAAGVLQRHVHIFHQARMGGQRVEQPLRDAIGIRVEEAHPVRPSTLGKPREQHGKAVAQAEILAIRSGVLADQRHFAHAGRGEIFRLAHDGFKAAAAELPAQLRNDAERAGMIAALGDLDVGGVARSGEQARRGIVIEKRGRAQRRARRSSPWTASRMRSTSPVPMTASTSGICCGFARDNAPPGIRRPPASARGRIFCARPSPGWCPRIPAARAR